MTEEKKEEKTIHKGVSRRQFIAGTVGGLVVGAAAGAVAGSLGFPKTVTAQPWLPAKWDYTTDVVVVGYGLGGQCAAIEAHNNGANVIVLEKAPQGKEGGTSRICGQYTLMPTPDLEDAMVTYLDNQDYLHLVSHEIHQAVAAELVKVEPWVTGLGGTTYIAGTPPYGLFPTFSVPGNQACVRKFINSPTSGNAHGWEFFDGVVKKLGIQILYGTPANSLIATPDKEVIGVVAQGASGPLYIKANRGVVLATGGFEANEEMVKSYAGSWPMYYAGSPYDTGDGYAMAQALGAKMLAMNDMQTPGMLSGLLGCIKVPDFEAVFNISWPTQDYILVNKYGKRFIAEDHYNHYGWGWKQILLFEKGPDLTVANEWGTMTFPNIPHYGIFDQTMMNAGPICIAGMGWNPVVEGYTWSKDNQTELAKGWIMKATTVEALAAAIAADPDNNGPAGTPLVDAATLSTTITNYNGFCAAKNDAELGRSAANLASISGPPYYAVKMWPYLHAVQGGPKRDANAQIIDVYENPIPRLYSCGEMGSWWGSGYDGGFCEGIASGRIAGRNAAAQTAWS